MLVESSEKGLRLLRLHADQVGAEPGEQYCSLILYRRGEGQSSVRYDYVDLCAWESARVRAGRIFLPDDHGKLKWSVPVSAHLKLQSYTGCELILANSGVVPVKMRGARPDIPTDTLHMRKMWMSAIKEHARHMAHRDNPDAAEPQAGHVYQGRCAVCGELDSSKSPAQVCPVCLVITHRSTCLRSIVQVCLFLSVENNNNK